MNNRKHVITAMMATALTAVGLTVWAQPPPDEGGGQSPPPREQRGGPGMNQSPMRGGPQETQRPGGGGQDWNQQQGRGPGNQRPSVGGQGPGGREMMGQQGQQPPPRSGGDMMGENFFAPESVMQNQRAIGLKDDQRKAIRSAMQGMMEKFNDLQWQQSDETEAMAALLKKDRVDEKEVLAQFDKLLNTENEIKRLHFGLMMKVKSILTPDQQVQLRQLRQQPLQTPEEVMAPRRSGRVGPDDGGRDRPGRDGRGGDGQGRDERRPGPPSDEQPNN